MSSKITKPYKFSKNEKAIIEANFISYNDWYSNVYHVMKNDIRDYLRSEQGNKCCYCKRELGFDIKDVDIDHIIPKSLNPNFTFEPLNLALSCPGCNTKKGDDNILIKAVIRYPKHSRNISIVHPHFDKYEDHIVIHNGCIFEPLSKKGSHTITTCELFRLKIVEERAKAVLSEVSIESELVNSLINASKEELNSIFNEIIKRIK